MTTSVLLDVAAVPFPVVFCLFSHTCTRPMPQAILSGQTTALADLCPGSHGSHSISWADSEFLYLQPRVPGAFCAIATSGACMGPFLPSSTSEVCGFVPPSSHHRLISKMLMALR